MTATYNKTVLQKIPTKALCNTIMLHVPVYNYDGHIFLFSKVQYK